MEGIEYIHMSEQRGDFMPEQSSAPASEEKEAAPAWLREYKPREWAVRSMSLAEKEYDELNNSLEPIPAMLCRSDSEVAKEIWERDASTKNLFFYDIEEQQAIQTDNYGIDRVGVLDRPWDGHPEGALAMVICRSVHEGTYEVIVAVAKPEV